MSLGELTGLGKSSPSLGRNPLRLNNGVISEDFRMPTLARQMFQAAF